MHSFSKQLLPARYCITTITCDQFAIGTEILIYSFLQYNPWFEGDINIVISKLSIENRQRLESIYPVKFINASQQLQQQVNLLREHYPHLHDIHLRFYSLEAFNLPQYDRVVYLDSDMHCAGDIKDLFLSDAPLLACLDGFSYEERIAPIIEKAGFSFTATQCRYGKQFKNSFNAGVISFAPNKLPRDHYLALINMLNLEAWSSYGSSIFTDQMVINRYFENQFEIISSQYNYMVFLGDYLHVIDNIAPYQAKIVHFAGKIKPWNEYDQSALYQSAPHYLQFIQHWRALLNKCRNTTDLTSQAKKLLNHYHWIEKGSDHQLEVISRLF